MSSSPGEPSRPSRSGASTGDQGSELASRARAPASAIAIGVAASAPWRLSRGGAAPPASRACRQPVGRRASGIGGSASSRHPGLTVPTANLPAPTSVGKGEGKLNLIAWEGYLRHPVGQAVREADRLHQSTPSTPARSDEMVSLMANGGGGQYDLVSASG